MTDLEIIEQALKNTIKRMNEADPRKDPPSFTKALTWILEAIDEIKKANAGQ